MGYDLEMGNTPVFIATDTAFLKVLRSMKDRGEITLEQYAESLRRAKQ